MLAGPSGVGKTTVGRALAERSGARFIDLDERVVRDAAQDVAGIFREEGEAGFRRRERAALEELAGEDGLVLALGGGTVGEGLPFWAAWPRVVLMAEVETLIERLGGSELRPMIGGGGVHRVEALRRQRMPGWVGFGLRVHTDGLSLEAVTRRVEAAW